MFMFSLSPSSCFARPAEAGESSRPTPITSKNKSETSEKPSKKVRPIVVAIHPKISQIARAALLSL